MKRALLAFTLLGGLLMAAGFYSNTDVSVKLNSHVGFAPLHITGNVAIAKDDRNREACLLFASPDLAAQSCKGLDGANEPVNNPIDKVLTVAGTYEISVVLYRNDGKVIQSNIERVEVLGTGVSEPHGGPDTGTELHAGIISRVPMARCTRERC